MFLWRSMLGSLLFSLRVLWSMINLKIRNILDVHLRSCKRLGMVVILLIINIEADLEGQEFEGNKVYKNHHKSRTLIIQTRKHKRSEEEAAQKVQKT